MTRSSASGWLICTTTARLGTGARSEQDELTRWPRRPRPLLVSLAEAIGEVVRELACWLGALVRGEALLEIAEVGQHPVGTELVGRRIDDAGSDGDGLIEFAV